MIVNVFRKFDEPPQEGDPITLSFYNEGRLIVQIVNYWWNKETYKNKFEEAGFKNFTCNPVLPAVALMKASK